MSACPRAVVEKSTSLPFLSLLTSPAATSFEGTFADADFPA